MAQPRRRRLQRRNRLVYKLVDASLVGFLPFHEEAAQDVVCAYFLHRVVECHPTVGELWRVADILVEVERLHLRHLLRVGLLHPYLRHLLWHLVVRHEQRGENLALAYVLFPQGYGEVVVVGQVGCHLLQLYERHAPIEAIVETLLAHRLRGRAVHHQPEATLQLFYLAFYFFFCHCRFILLS